MQATENSNQNQPSHKRRISRRRFLGRSLAAGFALAVLPTGDLEMSATPAQKLPRHKVLAYLETLKERIGPFTSLLAYLEKAAYLPSDQINHDLLIELWRDSEDAALSVRDTLQTLEFWENTINALIGKEAAHQACGRVLKGYEL